MKNSIVKKLIKLSALMLIIALLPISVLANSGAGSSAMGFDPETLAELQRRIDNLESENSSLRGRIRQLETARPQYPNIRLVQPQSIVLAPGEVRYVDIEIRNIGNGMASNALVTAAATGPIDIEFINNSNVLGNVGQNISRTVRTRLTADAGAPADTHTINLEFAFRTQPGNPETSQDSISVRIDAHNFEPRISLQNFTVDRAHILPGDNFTVSVQLANLGEGTAYNVQASIIEGLSSEGVFLAGAPDSPFFQSIEPGHQSTVSFPLTASNRISSGDTFELVFRVTGVDHAREDISQDIPYFVTVIAPEEGTNRAMLSMGNMSVDSRLVGVGEQASVTMYIINTGTLPARNIHVTASPDDEIAPSGGGTRRTISVLQPGESHFLSFAFSPRRTARTQYYDVDFEVSYDIGVPGDTETDSFRQSIGISVYNPDADEDDAERRSRPRMLVASYAVEPLIVSAGDEFDLFMTFQNSSAARAVYNIKISLVSLEATEGQGAVFTPVGASNTLFIDRLGPRETVDRQIRMFAVPDAPPRVYNIEVIFEYEDADFFEFEETEQISITVRQTTRIELGHLSIPDHGFMFQPVMVDFNIINSGRVALANLRVALEGNFDSRGVDDFVGNIGRGNTTTFTGQFTPLEPGEQRGVITVSGEDATGELIYYSHEFVIFVEDMGDDMFGGDFMMEGGRGGMDMMGGEFGGFGMYGEDGGGIAWWMWLAGGLAVVAVGGGIAFFVIKKKRNNRDLFQDLQ